MGGASPDARPVRSFVAIEVEDPGRAAIVDYLADLRVRVDDVAWTPPENLHVTLKFLGSVAPESLTPLAERLAAIAAGEPAFAITYSGLGAFPSASRPRILWIGAAAPALLPLARLVDAASALAGVAPEERAFHPHVTLGRLRDRSGARHAGRDHEGAARAALRMDGARSFGTAPARALVLFRSDTAPRGARHTPLARLPLAGGADGYE